VDVQGVPVSPTSSVNLQVVSQSIVCNAEVRGVGFISARMSDCLASGTEINKTLMPEPVPYRDRRIQSGTGILRYRTELQDARMQMPVASASMPMHSYVGYSTVVQYNFSCAIFTLKTRGWGEAKSSCTAVLYSCHPQSCYHTY
jgi:hypothetical protein